MTYSLPQIRVLFLSIGCGLGLWGCGAGPADSQTDATGPTQSVASTDKMAPFVPPAASIELSPPTESTPDKKTVEATDSASDTIDTSRIEEGTPQWMVREMTRLRTAPTDVVMEVNPKDPSQQKKIELTPQQAEKERLRRQFAIINLAQQVIAKTHADKDLESFFNNAVHYLADARMQLVLAGEKEQSALMEEDANALFQRDETSFAAVESAFKLMQLAQTQAQRNPEDSQWAIGFAKQSRLFAERFPQEGARASINLIAAARTCDSMGLYEEARKTLEVVEQKFSETPFADQVAGILRRLKLPGNELVEFGGSTHDGGFLSIDQYRGKTVLIAFWASNSSFFKRDLPTLQSAVSKYPNQVTAIGVNMDKDEIAVDQFLEQTGNPWKHIFYSNPDKRGSRNLVAHHYGVVQVPTYWLIDPNGIVRSINLPAGQVDQAIAETLK